MNTKVKKKALLSALNSVSYAVSKKGCDPIMSNIKIDVREQGDIMLSANNGEVSYMKKVQLETAPDGCVSICIAPKIISDILNSIKDDVIEIGVDDNVFYIGHSNGRFRTSYLSSEDFSIISKDKDCKKVDVESKLLSSLICDAVKFKSDDELRTNISGIYLYISDGVLGVCATDTRILYHNFSDCINDISCEGIIPSRSIPCVIDALKSSDMISIYFGEQTMTFRNEDSMIICTTPVVKFPDFRKIITRYESPCYATVDKGSLTGSVSRAVISSPLDTNIISISISENAISIKGEDLSSQKVADEQIECNTSGDITFGVRGDIFTKCISAVVCEDITIEASSPKKGIFLIDPSCHNKTILVMPVVSK